MPRPTVRRALVALVALGATLVPLAPQAAGAAVAYPSAPSWQRAIGEVHFGSPAVADVNMDGTKDVAQADEAGNLHVVDGATGTPLPGWPKPIQVRPGVTSPSDASPAIADLDRDGRPEIVVGAGSLYQRSRPHPGGVVVFNGDGTTRWRRESKDIFNIWTGGTPDGWGDGVANAPAVGDLNGDGMPEIVVGSYDHYIYAYDRFGGVLPGFPIDTADTIWSSPVLIDMDGNGALDIFVAGDATGYLGCWGGNLWAFDGWGRKKWHRCIGQVLYSSPAVGDLDGDGRPDLVFGTGNNPEYDRHPDSRSLFAVRADGGADLPGWPVRGLPGMGFTGSPAVGDLDGDGRDDVAYGTCSACPGRLYAFRSNGAKLWEVGVADEVISSPVIADANQDGRNDVVQGWSGGVEVLQGSNGARIYNRLTGRVVQNSVAVADIGGGRWRLIVASYQSAGSGRLEALPFPTPRSTPPWPMFRRSADRLGAPPMPAPPAREGYWLVARDGGIFPYGTAGGYGSTGGMRLNQPIVGMAATPTGRGYWLVASDGGIFPFGDAPGLGSTGHIRLNQPIVGMAATSTGRGYWLVAADGGIFPFGDAPGVGSLGGTRLNRPIIGISASRSGRGYLLLAADGGLFPFGDAQAFGSMGGGAVPAPVVAMAGTRAPSGGGYWMVGADGGVYPFGAAVARGGMARRALNQPIVGMAASPAL